MCIAPVVRIAALVLVVAASQARAEDVRIPVPGSGTLVLPAPEGWRLSRPPGPVPTVSFAPASGNAFQVLVSPLLTADRRPAPASRESLRRLVEAGADEAKSQSIEKALPIRSFGAGDVQGQYFSATDRAPGPGEFKYMTQGAMSVGGLVVDEQPLSLRIAANGEVVEAIAPSSLVLDLL